MKVDVVNGKPSKGIPRVVVMVDVFRASSTITAALENGAECVVPISSIRNAIRYVNAIKRRTKVVLAGERYGITPKGFSHGGSPLEMTRGNVERGTIVYSSTNLTRILSRITQRSKLLIGSLNNAKAVANYIRKFNGHELIIVACGTKQGPGVEDLTGAGAIVNYLKPKDLTDDALIALGVYRNPNWRHVAESGRVAERLRSLGFDKDIDFCLSENTSSVVPGLVGGRLVNLSR